MNSHAVSVIARYSTLALDIATFSNNLHGTNPAFLKNAQQEIHKEITTKMWLIQSIHDTWNNLPWTHPALIWERSK